MRGGGLSRLVIVDDGSKDDTYKVIEERAASLPLLHPITKQNGGHGSAVLSGYQFAVDSGANFIFQTDSDGQTDPAEFESFWKARSCYDAIFGNRIERGDGKGRWFVERILCFILKHYFKVNLPDANAPYRLMNRKFLCDFLPELPKDYNLPNVMLTTFGVFYKRKIKFMPVSFKPRQGGKQSLNLKSIFKIGVHSLKDFKQFQKRLQQC